MKPFYKILKYLILYIATIYIFIPAFLAFFLLFSNDSINRSLSYYYFRLFGKPEFTLLIIIGTISLFFVLDIIKILVGIIKKRFDKKIAYRKFLSSFLPIGSFYILLLFINIFVFRGFFTFEFHDREDKKSEVDFSYEIKQTENGWKFKIKNNEFKFRTFLTYRNYNAIYDISDSIFIKYVASRIKIEDDSTVFEDHWGFDCGTGLGTALIYPYEEFSTEFHDINEILSNNYNLYYSEKYCKTIFSDSVDVSFFLPVYDFDSRIPKKVFSNPIRIDYQKLYNMIEKEFIEHVPKMETLN